MESLSQLESIFLSAMSSENFDLSKINYNKTLEDPLTYLASESYFTYQEQTKFFEWHEKFGLKTTEFEMVLPNGGLFYEPPSDWEVADTPIIEKPTYTTYIGAEKGLFMDPYVTITPWRKVPEEIFKRFEMYRFIQNIRPMSQIHCIQRENQTKFISIMENDKRETLVISFEYINPIPS